MCSNQLSLVIVFGIDTTVSFTILKLSFERMFCAYRKDMGRNNGIFVLLGIESTALYSTCSHSKGKHVQRTAFVSWATCWRMLVLVAALLSLAGSFPTGGLRESEYVVTMTVLIFQLGFDDWGIFTSVEIYWRFSWVKPVEMYKWVHLNYCGRTLIILYQQQAYARNTKGVNDHSFLLEILPWY